MVAHLLSVLLMLPATVSEQATPVAPPLHDKPDNFPREYSDDIVVVGKRPEERPEDRPQAEKEFSEAEIEMERANNIGELLADLAPFIDPAGAQPVLLINGKPAGFDQSILSYPPEALAKIVVLKTSSGTTYGAQPGIRVVNLVLKRKFSSWDASSAVSAATAGGQHSEAINVSRSAIFGDARWSVNVRESLQGALSRSARVVPDFREADSIVPTRQSISSTVSADFPTSYLDKFTTLQPSVNNTAFGLNYARPIGGLTASATLDGSVNTTRSKRGLPIASIMIVGSGDAPSTLQPVQISASRAFKADTEGHSLGASLSLAGPVHGVQSSAAASYNMSQGNNLIETGVDVASLQRQALIQGAIFNPFVPFDPSYLIASQTRSTTENLTLRLELRKSVLKLPAGLLTWTFNATRFSGTSRFRQSGADPSPDTRSSFHQTASHISVGIPVSRPGSGFGAFGDLTVNLSLGRQIGSGGSAGASYASGFTWSPMDQIQFDGSVDIATTPPSFDQLYGLPTATTSHLFDYNRGEYAAPVWTTGGNPDLRSGRQSLLALALTLMPFRSQGPTLRMSYRRTTASDNPVSFPEPTPSIETAFPERFSRDSGGHLVGVDARPINIARLEDATADLQLTERTSSHASRGSLTSAQHTHLNPIEVQVALTYRMRLTSKYQFRAGLPAIDRLSDTGQPRHQVDVRINLSRRAYGFDFSATWRSQSQLRAEGTFLSIQEPILIDTGFSVEIDKLGLAKRDVTWPRHLRLSLNIQNLLNTRRKVTLPDGSTPAGYNDIEADPLGRTIQVSVRKQF